MCHTVSFMLPNVNEQRVLCSVARELCIRTDLLVSLTYLINFPMTLGFDFYGWFFFI